MVPADDNGGRGLLMPLVDVLARVPILSDRAGRTLVIRMMSAELREPLLVEESQTAIGHLFNLAEVCRRSPERLSALVRIVARIDHDTRAMVELRRVVAELTPLDLFPTSDRARLFTLLAGVVVPDIADIYRVVAGPKAPSLYGSTTYVEVFRVLEALNAGPDGVPRPLVFVEHIAARVRTELAIELHRWNEAQAVSMGLAAELTAVRDSLRPERARPFIPPPGSPAYLVFQLDRDDVSDGRYRMSYWRQSGDMEGWSPRQGETSVGTLAELKDKAGGLIEAEIRGDDRGEIVDEEGREEGLSRTGEVEGVDLHRRRFQDSPTPSGSVGDGSPARDEGALTGGPRRTPASIRPLRMGFIVDIVGYGKRPWRLRDLAQRRVSELADAVVGYLGLDDAMVDRQGTGDGVLVFLPAEIDVSRTLSLLLPTWRDLLREDNALYTDRLQLRMAVTLGPVAPGPLGFVGDSATALGRLIDSQVLRTAVAAHAGVDLFVLLSDTLHSLVVDPSNAEFTRHAVVVKDYRSGAWLWVGRTW